MTKKMVGFLECVRENVIWQKVDLVDDDVGQFNELLCIYEFWYSKAYVFGEGASSRDPLSPYLFILVAEGLTTLIHQAVGIGDIHGV